MLNRFTKFVTKIQVNILCTTYKLISNCVSLCPEVSGDPMMVCKKLKIKLGCNIACVNNINKIKSVIVNKRRSLL